VDGHSRWPSQKAIPLSILAWLVLGLTLALASEQTDVMFQGTCKLVYEVYSNCGDLPAARKDLKREDVRPRRVLVGTIFLLAIGFIYLLIR